MPFLTLELLTILLTKKTCPECLVVLKLLIPLFLSKKWLKIFLDKTFLYRDENLLMAPYHNIQMHQQFQNFIHIGINSSNISSLLASMAPEFHPIGTGTGLRVQYYSRIISNILLVEEFQFSAFQSIPALSIHGCYPKSISYYQD